MPIVVLVLCAVAIGCSSERAQEIRLDAALSTVDGSLGGCFGQGKDLPGRTVRVTNQDGELLDSAVLGKGEAFLLSGGTSICHLPFTAVVADAEEYTFTVEGFVPQTLERDYVLGSSDNPPAQVPLEAIDPAPTCYQADQSVVAIIDAGLRTVDAQNHLGSAYQASSGRYLYLVANINGSGGVRTSSNDVWVLDGGTEPYALSDGARTLSTFPDGRELDVSASDGPAMEAMDCLGS